MSEPTSKNEWDVRVVLRLTWEEIARESKRIPLVHWNESVFRFIFVRALLHEHPHIRCDVEWRRIDLLVCDDKGPSLVEFKYYVRPWLVDLSGKRVRPKGGPSQQNFSEFCSCIKKLGEIDAATWRPTDDAAIAHRYAIVAYADSSDMVGRRSYGHWYDEISLPDEIRQKASVTRVLDLDGIHCPVADAHYKCMLLEVTANY